MIKPPLQNNGTLAYGIIFDNLLKIPTATLRAMVNLYALLYEAVLTNDSFLMTNDRLQELLMTADGTELLRNGIIIPLRRDTVGSFAELRKLLEEKKMAHFCATPKFANFLDLHAQTRPFPMSEVGSAFKAMSARILEPEVLHAFGISEKSIEIALRAIQAAKDRGVTNMDNTFFYEQVCPLLPSPENDLLNELVRAPYGLNLPSLLKTGIVGPEGFRGDQVLAALRGKTKKTTTLGVTGADQVVKSLYTSNISDPLINWLLSEEIISTMSSEELSAARSTSNRLEYLTKLTQFLADPNQLNWAVLSKSLLDYLHMAGKEVFRLRSRRDQITTEPAEGDVRIEGGNSLRLISDQPVELRGIDASAEPDLSGLEIRPLQVIGNTFNVPDPEAFGQSATSTQSASQTGASSNGGTITAPKIKESKDKKGIVPPRPYEPAIYVTN